MFYAEKVGTPFHEFMYSDVILVKAQVKKDDPKYQRYIAFGSSIASASGGSVGLEKSLSKSPHYIR